MQAEQPGKRTLRFLPLLGARARDAVEAEKPLVTGDLGQQPVEKGLCFPALSRPVKSLCPQQRRFRLWVAHARKVLQSFHAVVPPGCYARELEICVRVLRVDLEHLL